ncbi:MAG: hypothetical protein IIU14_03990 [Ruminococcus sp.]|nr:hypothetical protein [Ruminococcus sp.]
MKQLKRFWKWLCKTKTRTVALFFSVAYSVAFTVTVIILSTFAVSLPESLIICVYTECGVIGLTSGAIALKSLRVGEVELELEQSEVNEDD